MCIPLDDYCCCASLQPQLPLPMWENEMSEATHILIRQVAVINECGKAKVTCMYTGCDRDAGKPT